LCAAPRGVLFFPGCRLWVEMSETEKAEGSVTCCNVIFDA